MTVETGALKAGPFTGNNITTAFAFAFKVFADTDIRVIETLLSTLVSTDLTLNSGYTVTRNADQDASPGGTVTYAVLGVTTALPSTKKLTIVADFDFEQSTDLPNGGAFFAANVEKGLDRTTLLVKQLKELVDSSLSVSPTTSAAFDPTVPEPEENTVLMWVDDGSGGFRLENFDPATVALGITSSELVSHTPTIGSVTDVRTVLRGLVDGTTFYGQTAAELSASVTPTNYTVPSHTAIGVIIVDRYGTNTTPGTTNMSTALQNAVNVASAATASGGRVGVPIRFLTGVYKIVTPPVFTPASIDMKPYDIGGAGYGTQIINAAGASLPTFNFINVGGFYLHDLVLTGNTANLNDGVFVGLSSNIAIRWRIERVTSFMAGRGIVVSSSNTGSIVDFKHWPDNGDKIPAIAPVVTLTDVDHGIYLTGTFAHDIHIERADCCPRTSFKANARGIYCDASGPNHNVSITDSVVQSSPASTREGIRLVNCNAWRLTSIYNESSRIVLVNSNYGTMIANGNGGVEGYLLLAANCVQNTFIGVQTAVLDLNDSTCIRNLFVGCHFSTTLGDLAPLSTRYIHCSGPAGLVLYDFGGQHAVDITYSAAMTPNAANGEWQRIVVTNGTAMTINAPTNPRHGRLLEFTVYNTSGGAMGVITWNAIYKKTAFTNPANTFNRTICFRYEAVANVWVQVDQATVDVPN